MFRPVPLSKVARCGAASSAGQKEFGPQSSDRGPAKGQASAIESRKIDHDRQAQTRAGLGFVQPLSAAGYLGTLLLRKAASVVVDNDPQHRRYPRRGRLLDHDLDGYARGGPFAGIVDEVADHLLQILPLATKLCLRHDGNIDRDAAIAVDLLHRPAQGIDHRADLGYRADDGEARRDACPLEMARYLIAHQVRLLKHFFG